MIAVAIVVGVLAGLVQMLGLLRWVYLVPWLARAHVEAKPEEQRSIEITFEAFHRFLGVGVGEHLGYLLTGLWSRAGSRYVQHRVVAVVGSSTASARPSRRPLTWADAPEFNG